ncbi:Cof subfamily protein (haloacid dehalogenase superfamily) [Bacilli bacterium PM5-3]|nr:Cof subfamily protein (haloacid dehalogenase superfamily) [Bacilli bacterium PM5-3]MDH6603517.1 Cof subfamily protein (haloacid dehalogenase superfamily) [Bacilli bacterium PM5-9]
MFENIKIAFFDVDGTLYSHYNNGISNVLREALKKLKDNGIILCIATGRPIEMLRQLDEFLEDIQFDYLITSNGQAIYQDNKLVYKNFLNPEDVKAVIKKANELDLSLSLVSDDINIITKMNETARKSCESVEFACPVETKVDETFNQPVDHLVCYETTKNMKYFAPILKHSVMTHWSVDVFDFVPDNGVKANGIMKVLNHLKIDAKDAIAFGDGQNDIDMLKYVGFGVAMGNASIDVQEAADYVCEHINDEGVVNTLKKIKLI